MIRKFSLKNTRGDLLDLLNSLDYFAYSPEGLGVTVTNTLLNAGINAISQESVVNASAFSLGLVIGRSGNPYQKYDELVTFLDYAPYTLIYETDSGEWLRDIKLAELTKTELQGNYLIEKITFDCLSVFYREINESLNISDKSNETPKMYNYVYGNSVYLGNKNGFDGVFSIKNNSRYLNIGKGSPIEITIEGPAINPYWELLKGSDIVQSDGFNVTIQEGYKLIVSSVPNQQKAFLISPTGVISNVYQQQQLTRTGFIEIPSGNSELIFKNCKNVSFKYRQESVIV